MGLSLVTHRSNRKMFAKNSQRRSRSISNPDTNHATFFKSEDVSGFYPADFRHLKKKTHFEYLKQLNSGRNLGLDNYNDAYITYEMGRHHIEAVASQLDMTTTERKESRRHFLALDRQRLGLDLDLVAYCVCAYTVEQNDRNTEQRCHPNVLKDEQNESFRRLASSLGLSQTAIVKTYGKIQHRVGDTVPAVHHDYRDPDHHPGGT